MQNETALHFQNDVGKTLGIGTELIRRTFGERCFRVQSDPKLKCGAYLSNCAARKKTLPQFHFDCLAGFTIFARVEPQQSVRLTQSVERVRFLPADRGKASAFQSSPKIMRAIAVIGEIGLQSSGNSLKVEIGGAHQSQNRRPDELQKSHERRHRISGQSEDE